MRPQTASFSKHILDFSEPDPAGNYQLGFTQIEVPLSSALSSSRLWLEHPTWGRQADVAAIDVTERVSDGTLELSRVNDLVPDGYAPPAASEDIFILGYPLGRLPGLASPIWKRGAIATDPTFDIGGLPMLYVDTATRPGMSGSIVLVRMSAAKGWTTKDGANQVGLGHRDQVLGVYSGALGAHHVEAQLGLVWKHYVIAETIAGQSSPRL